jgi:hypothetical protein
MLRTVILIVISVSLVAQFWLIGAMLYDEHMQSKHKRIGPMPALFMRRAWREYLAEEAAKLLRS